MTSKRRFITGDEWLYLKIYSGPKQLENILLNVVFDITDHSFSKRYIDKFYFVRYFDGEHHLRCRFHLTETRHLNEILIPFADRLRKYIDNRILTSVSTDTYTREIERYNLVSIENAETLFTANSLEVLSMIKQNDDYTHRVLKSMQMANSMLNLLRFTPEKKQKVFETLTNNFAKEFASGKHVNETLKTKFREWGKPVIDMLMKQGNEPLFTSLIHPEINIQYQQILGMLADRIENEEIKEENAFSFIASLLHMHFNRVFRVKQRSHEFVIYYIMNHSMKSAIARQKNITVQI